MKVCKDVSVVSGRSSLSDVCSRVSDQFGLNQLFDDVKTGGDVMIDSWHWLLIGQECAGWNSILETVH